MPTESIEYYNRYSQSIEKEAIYGEGFLRWAYTRKLGRFSVELFAKRILFSKFYGFLMNRHSSKKKIAPFIEQYNVVMDDYEKPPHAYKHFNDFFCRKLKPGVRKIDANPNTVTFPADGRHMGFQDVSKAETIFVKGQSFNLSSLLGCEQLAVQYKEGSLILSRLCPVDYHRFHFPISGIPKTQKLINGYLYSVNPLALKRNLQILSENRRVFTPLETQSLGQVLILEIGATCVGSIVQTFKPDAPVEKGAEKGYFQFGASATLLLFEKDRIQLASDLIQQTQSGRELYAHMGDTLGTFC